MAEYSTPAKMVCVSGLYRKNLSKAFTEACQYRPAQVEIVYKADHKYDFKEVSYL